MELWLEIAISVIAVLGIIFGTSFALKWKHACDLLKELGEAFEATGEALEDKKLTKEEAIGLLKEWQEVVVAIMLMLGKG